MAQSENVKKFFEAVSMNEDLQKELKTVTDKSSAAVQKAIEAQTDSIVSVAKKAGFEFTAEDFIASFLPENDKIDPDELDAIAGGKIKAFCVIIGGSDGYQARTINFGGKSHGGICKYVGIGLWCW
jgi:predicted ribosomally synthesized peptide with nif11-like leader